MTFKKEGLTALFYADEPPQVAGGVIDWAYRQFVALQAFLRRPEFPAIVLSRIDALVHEEFKAEDGMLVYAGPGTLGPQEGLYIRESGVWKKIAGT